MSTSTNPLHVDIPVTLPALRVAFSVPSLTFEGDLPASIFHMRLLKTDAEAWNADAMIIAVFHTNAGHVTLNVKAPAQDRPPLTRARRHETRVCADSETGDNQC